MEPQDLHADRATVYDGINCDGLPEQLQPTVVCVSTSGVPYTQSVGVVGEITSILIEVRAINPDYIPVDHDDVRPRLDRQGNIGRCTAPRAVDGGLKSLNLHDVWAIRETEQAEDTNSHGVKYAVCQAYNVWIACGDAD